ncbi:MAG: hypothetical protein ACI9SI_000844 [Polaribacter sp.]|jgi:hypothetical protein
MKKTLLLIIFFSAHLLFSQESKQIDYSYINTNKDFIKLYGDFYTLKYNDSDYHFIPRDFPTTPLLGNNIVQVMIRTSDTSKESIKKQKIRIESLN